MILHINHGVKDKEGGSVRQLEVTMVGIEEAESEWHKELKLAFKK